MTQETIVAIYDSAYAAGAACAELVDAGLPDDAVTWTSAAPAQADATRPRRERSFWSTLFGGEPDHDTTVYDRSVESGSDVLTVRVPGEHVAKCIEILEKHRPVDIDERARSYRLTPRDVASADDDTIFDGVAEALPLAATRASGARLPVGGRLVDRGTTRVRRFVVEVPVQEGAVHAAPAAVERHPVEGAAPSPAAINTEFEARTETGEIPADFGRQADAAGADDTVAPPRGTWPR